MNKIQSIVIAPFAGLLFVVAGGAASAADSPGKLRTEMAKAEQDYVALYNKLNSDRQFDIVCKTDRPTGSSFPVRVCQPRYLLRATEKSATERMQSAVGAADSTGGANARGPDVGAGAGASGAVVGQPDKQQAFRQNILDVQQKSPELQALGLRRDELQARYDVATKADKSGR